MIYICVCVIYTTTNRCRKVGNGSPMSSSIRLCFGTALNRFVASSAAICYTGFRTEGRFKGKKSCFNCLMLLLLLLQAAPMFPLEVLLTPRTVHPLF